MASSRWTASTVPITHYIVVDLGPRLAQPGQNVFVRAAPPGQPGVLVGDGAPQHVVVAREVHVVESQLGDGDAGEAGTFAPTVYLGRAPAARSQLAEALSGVGEDRVRRRAIDAALLAATWLRTGHLDRACAAGRDAVAYAARTGSGRCIERVAGVLADLRAHDDYAPARELREFARVVLPEADGMAVTLSGGS